MSTLLRRLPLSRLLLLCALTVAVGIGATAIALALATGPTPPEKPLAEAVHDALAGPAPNGVSARIQYTNHLLEGANLSSGGGEASRLSSSPLLSGATGRLWVGSEGHARLELQSEKGDTQILYDGHTVSLYDASSNTLYRYTPPQHSSDVQNGAEGGTARAGSSTGGSTSTQDSSAQDSSAQDSSSDAQHNPPSVTQIEEGIARLSKHALVSHAMPTDIGGQPAYTVRISPREHGGLIAGAELSWDAENGAPLRAAVYSTASSTPAIELAAREVSFGPVESSALNFTPPENAKLHELKPPSSQSGSGSGSSTTSGSHPHVTLHGKGLEAIALLEANASEKAGEETPSELQSLPKVDINGTSASELQTELGTLLTFERAGVRYLLAGSVTPSTIEAFARSL